MRETRLNSNLANERRTRDSDGLGEVSDRLVGEEGCVPKSVEIERSLSWPGRH